MLEEKIRCIEEKREEVKERTRQEKGDFLFNETRNSAHDCRCIFTRLAIKIRELEEKYGKEEVKSFWGDVGNKELLIVEIEELEEVLKRFKKYILEQSKFNIRL